MSANIAVGYGRTKHPRVFSRGTRHRGSVDGNCRSYRFAELDETNSYLFSEQLSKTDSIRVTQHQDACSR